MTPFRMLLFIFIASLLAAAVQLGALQIAFDKLGLAPESAIWILMTSVLGSTVNLPIGTIQAEASAERKDCRGIPKYLLRFFPEFPERTLVTVNVGGCVVPLSFALYLFLHASLQPGVVITAIGLVTLIAYSTSALLPGVGVVMPMLAAPLGAAFVGTSLDPAHPAALAYISGTLGVLLGADVLRLKEIGSSGETAVSIGGAGTFDGIFLTGVLAALIA